MPTLKIDGKEITVDKGTTIIRAALKLGIEIPHYCWHPGLSVAGNCRMCLVEVEKAPKPQIACHIECQDGMVVSTNTERVKKLRQHVLEFLLVNHPLDCPVCDQAGECRLQDYYMKHGLYDSRVNEDKIKKTKKAFSIGPTIMLDTERCILCSRCVRFSDEITKTGDFGIFNRGAKSEIGLYPGKELDNKYSGNVADICPVGALTDKDFRFKMRVWYLKSTESVCPGCSRGCNILVEAEGSRPYRSDKGRVMRLKPRFNDDVNDYWMCDAGRYGYKSIDENRILEPKMRLPHAVKTVSWDEMLDTVESVLSDILKKSKDRIAVLLSPDMTNEELFLAKKFFGDELGVRQIALVSARPEGDQDDLLIRSDKHPNRKGAEFLGFVENTQVTQNILNQFVSGGLDAVFVFGQDLISLFPNLDLTKAFSKIPLSVFIGPNQNLTSEHASYVLPSACYAEIDGTFTNFEGRVQRIKRALNPIEESKAIYWILPALAAKLGQTTFKEVGAETIFTALSQVHADFNGVGYQEIGSSGVKASCLSH